MTDVFNEDPICSKCGRKMVSGKVAVRLNMFCIKEFDGWYCPDQRMEVDASN